MAATNYTPISLYYSTTASAVPLAVNLTNGELAININTADGKLYYKDSAGVVQLLAQKGGGTVANGCIYLNNLTISANYTIAAAQGAHSVGPITVASGVTVTVSSGSRYVVS